MKPKHAGGIAIAVAVRPIGASNEKALFGACRGDPGAHRREPSANET